MRASIAAIRAVKEADPSARFVQAEPIIHIAADDEKPEDAEGAVRHTAAQFEAWDMIAGREAPELGGSEECLDMIELEQYASTFADVISASNKL